MTPSVEAHDLHRTHGRGATAVSALRGVSLHVPTGQFVAVHGRSGAGKTTLLNVLGGLERPDAGTVTLAGHDLSAMPEAERVRLRRDHVGFVFQTFGLLPVLTAAENVEVPLRMRRTRVAERDRRVAELLELVGLDDRAAHRPAELSGGEQQRVAIARALANRPKLLVADEPTGQLDSATGHTVMQVLQALARDQGVTTIVATHDDSLITTADRVLEMRDGMVVADDTRPRTP